MALESGTYISDLNPSNPVGATDKVSTLDDHVRLIKSTLQNTFPNISGEVSATHTELSFLDGVTGTTGTGRLVLDDAPTIADLTVTDSITVNGALDSNGNADINGSVTVSGASHFESTARDVSAPAVRIGESGSTNTPGVLSIVRAGNPNLVLYNLNSGAEALLQVGTSVIFGAETANALHFRTNATARMSIDAAGDVSMTGALSVGGTITGNGSGLSSLNASNLSSGTVPSARLPATIGGNKTFSDNVTINGAVRAGTAATSTSATLAAGQIHHRSSNTTVPSMNAGQWVAVQNTSTSSITLSQGSGVTLELGGTTTTGNRTLLPKGFAFIYFRANGVGVVHGSGVT